MSTLQRTTSSSAGTRRMPRRPQSLWLDDVIAFVILKLGWVSQGATASLDAGTTARRPDRKVPRRTTKAQPGKRKVSSGGGARVTPPPTRAERIKQILQRLGDPAMASDAYWSVKLMAREEGRHPLDLLKEIYGAGTGEDMLYARQALIAILTEGLIGRGDENEHVHRDRYNQRLSELADLLLIDPGCAKTLNDALVDPRRRAALDRHGERLMEAARAYDCKEIGLPSYKLARAVGLRAKGWEMAVEKGLTRAPDETLFMLRANSAAFSEFFGLGYGQQRREDRMALLGSVVERGLETGEWPSHRLQALGLLPDDSPLWPDVLAHGDDEAQEVAVLRLERHHKDLLRGRLELEPAPSPWVRTLIDRVLLEEKALAIDTQMRSELAELKTSYSPDLSKYVTPYLTLRDMVSRRAAERLQPLFARSGRVGLRRETRKADQLLRGQPRYEPRGLGLTRYTALPASVLRMLLAASARAQPVAFGTAPEPFSANPVWTIPGGTYADDAWGWPASFNRLTKRDLLERAADSDLIPVRIHVEEGPEHTSEARYQPNAVNTDLGNPFYLGGAAFIPIAVDTETYRGAPLIDLDGTVCPRTPIVRMSVVLREAGTSAVPDERRLPPLPYPEEVPPR